MTSPLRSPFPEERRLATVMFADVHGFTALAEHLDDETVSDLIKGIWSRLDTIVEAHGGYIDKHMGDGVMAVWGAPFAGDNDAERAVAAALALVAALDEYARQSRVAGVSRLKLRVGLNTGTVFAGYVGKRGEYTVIGDTVNVASRFEQSAEPGTVVIGEATLRMVRGAFRVGRLAPLDLKGKTEPVMAFVVEGTLAEGGRVRYGSLDSLETCMVGRDGELQQLGALFQQAMQSTVPVMALVTGEAGMGKSRLLMEFAGQMDASENGPLLVTARSLAQAAGVPFYLWKLIWHTLFMLRDDEPPQERRHRFLREVRRYWGQELGQASAVETAHLVGNLIGLEWPASTYVESFGSDLEALRARAYTLTHELLRRIVLYRPLLLVLDDLQWADRSSLDLLYSLFEPVAGALPVFILAGARPEWLRQQPRWANAATLLALEPLPADAATISAAYPALGSLSPAVLAELALRAEGNPYFLEEMVKTLLKSGAWPASERGGFSEEELLAQLRAQMPESLRAMLQARLDGLSPEARSVALLASVVGRVFWVGAVIAAARCSVGSGTGLLGMAPLPVVERIVQDGLRQLTRAELAFPRANTTFSGDQEYIFKASLLREVAYSLIPNKHRTQYHLAVGRWLATRLDTDFKVMAAEHFELAGAFEEAAHQYEQAARPVQGRGAWGESQAMAARARELRERTQEKV